MSDEREYYGPPPDGGDLAELLGERYTVKKGEKIAVTTSDDPLPAMTVVLEGGRDRYEIALEYLRGAGQRDPWMVLADAMDSLFGTLLESGRAYRDLPQGDDVEYEGAYFRVRVARDVPELSIKADRILGETN